MHPFSTDLGLIAAELPDALVVLDLSGDILWANDATISLMGLESDEWIGKSAFLLMHPDDHAVAIDAFSTVAESSLGRLMDVRVRDGNGMWRQCELRGRFVAGTGDGDGATHERLSDDGFVVIVLRDVADRHNLELAAGDKNLLRALVHHSLSLLMMLDSNGAIVTANAELSRSLRRDITVAKGERLDSLMVPADRALFRDMLRSIKGSADVTVRFNIPEGSDVHFDISITDLRDDPLVEGFVVSGTNITSLVDTQRALRHMADHDALTGLLSRRPLIATDISDRIKAALAEPIFAGDEIVTLQVSVGNATSIDHPTAARLILAADHAMYSYKHDGWSVGEHQVT